MLKNQEEQTGLDRKARIEKHFNLYCVCVYDAGGWIVSFDRMSQSLAAAWATVSSLTYVDMLPQPHTAGLDL